MDPTIVSSIIGAVALIFSTIFTILYTSKLSNSKLKKEQKSLENQMDNENLDKRNQQIELDLSKAEALKSKGITEEINFVELNNLKLFYEVNKTKVDMMELANFRVPYQVYYNFAVYKTFIEQSPFEGKHYIDKITSYDESNEIPILRWKARISRLCGNEGDAVNQLSELISLEKIVKDPKYLSRLFRSRGFAYLNLHKYEIALKDFNSSIELSIKANTPKSPYAYIGASICYAKLNDLPNSLLSLNEGQELEDLFNFDSSLDFENKIEILRREKKYYISDFEKHEFFNLVNGYFH